MANQDGRHSGMIMQLLRHVTFSVILSTLQVSLSQRLCFRSYEGGGFPLVVEDHKKPALNGVKRQINEASGSITGDTRQKKPSGLVSMAKPLITVTTTIFIKGEQLNFAT